MYNKIGSIRKITIPFIWMSTGVLTWYLSAYLFSYIVSPFFIRYVRTINAVTHSVFIKDIANMFFTNISDFILSFIFALILSLITKFTWFRLALYIFGAIAFSVYGNLENLTNYIRIYPELPSGAMTSFILGFISLLLLVPISALAGSKLGTYIKMKMRTS